MALSDIISITISSTGAGVTAAGFGTPLIVGYIDPSFTGVQTFTSLASLATALDTAVTTEPTAHPIYLAAQALLSQSPRVTSFMVASLTTAPDRKIKLTPVLATTGTIYSVEVTDIDGVTETASYTQGVTQTVAAVCTGLHSAIEALTNKIAATDGTTYLTIDSDATKDYFWVNITVTKPTGVAATPVTDYIITEEVAAIAADTTDIAAIRLLDDTWYGLLAPDRRSAPQIKAIAAVVESAEKVAMFASIDTRSLTTGIAGAPIYDLKAASYDRCLAFYSGDDIGYLDAAVLGIMLPNLPGSMTLAFKQLSGPAYDLLSDTQVTAITGQGGCYYSAILGVACTNGGTAGGKSPGGTYLDLTWGRDWLKARMQENIIQLLVDNGKVPYTQKGADMVAQQIKQPLMQGIRYGFIADDPAPTVTTPNLDDVSDADKLNRYLPDVEFSATVQGAIQRIAVTGSLEV